MTDHKPSILLVTGKDAYYEIVALDWSEVKKRYNLTFLEAPVPIAAFIPPEQLASVIDPFKVEEIDYILVSGLIPWDVSQIKSKFSAKIKKGPKFLATLPEILISLDIAQLSPVDAAEGLLKQSVEMKIAAIMEQNTRKAAAGPTGHSFVLSSAHPDIIFGPDLPPVVLGEILDVPKLSFEQICQRVESYLAVGVQIIDLGCVASEDHSGEIGSVISRLKEKFSAPFSIDSANPAEINAAVAAGAEMVLSFSMDNYHKMLDISKEIPIVIVPVNYKSGEYPRNSKECIAGLMQLGKSLSEAGFQKIFMDPITGTPISPGITSTIETLRILRAGLDALPNEDDDGNPMMEPQLFMGFGNVTELVDGDSPGINTMLALIASEVGVSAILTTEASKKTRHNLEELAQSLKLAYYARQMHAPPVNLGINALRLKSKKAYPKYIGYGEPIQEIPTEEKVAEMDPIGFFKIYLDESRQRIIVTHFKNNVSRLTVTKTFEGTTAESLYKAILQANLVSRLDHAAYLGKELMRAELALKYGIEYIQN